MMENLSKENIKHIKGVKHCHFSILYNELPFLKQKLPFLYKHFGQLIFFDLNVGTENPHFSLDGSHEFIRDYPDPDKKITLINKKDIIKNLSNSWRKGLAAINNYKKAY